MESNKPVASKKQILKEKRRQRLQRRRLRLALIAGGAIILLIALVAFLSSSLSGNTEEDIIRITPIARPMANGTAMGDPNAPVKIEVYSDFQCPACQRFAREVEPLIVENYIATGKVYFIYRHFPFIDDYAATKESDQAANASMCAAEQQRFWDYHDILFANWNGENLGAFTNKRLVTFAQALNLDMEAFNQCFKENRYRDEIQRDLSAGKRANVQGTPTVFVNGKVITPGYVPSFEDIQQAVEAALASSQQ